MPKFKALVLFSGGLDSMLAVKLLQAQGIEVDAICFASNFFNCENAKKAAENLGVKLKVVDISKEMLDIVKNPLSGYGKHLNPCIDCRALMVKLAADFLSSKAAASRKGGKYDFIATGEVLGQRPFSQNKDAFNRVKNLSGADILRPLSAKLLNETEVEKKGIVTRGKLLKIQGRCREEQFELAKKYKISKYLSPAGGCLLTDPEFSERLLKMLDWKPDCGNNDVSLLHYGRIFWLKTNHKQRILIVVGRHEKDNQALNGLAQTSDIVLELKEIAGPTAIIRGKGMEAENKEAIIGIEIPKRLKLSELELEKEKNQKEILRISAMLAGYYAVKARGKKVKIKIKRILK